MTDTTWVGGNPLDRRDPFNGLFVVFNMGDRQVPRISKDFVKVIADSISDAHADGFLVVYLFEPNMAGDISDVFGSVEGMDTTWFWSEEINLALDPEVRKKELEGIASRVVDGCEKSGKFEFGGNKAAFCGLIRIDGEAVLMPRTELAV